MKNIFKNKKVVAFGIVGFFAVALVTAGLVSYLSNPISSSFNVTSPMEVTISPATAEIYGGESVAYEIIVKNSASVPITGKTSITVTNPEGVKCDNFDSIMVGMITPWEIAPVNILSESEDSGSCWTIGANRIGLMFGPVEDTYEVGRIDNISVEATLKQNAIGTYTFNVQILEPTA